jgi:DNA-directed RNA polymerase specialized sigma24 family protein
MEEMLWLSDEMMEHSSPMWDSRPRSEAEIKMAYRVQAVLASMNPRQAELLRKHFFEGLGATELARTEGVGARTMRYNISRAKAAFVRAMEKWGGEFATPAGGTSV